MLPDSKHTGNDCRHPRAKLWLASGAKKREKQQAHRLYLCTAVLGGVLHTATICPPDSGARHLPAEDVQLFDKALWGDQVGGTIRHLPPLLLGPLLDGLHL